MRVVKLSKFVLGAAIIILSTPFAAQAASPNSGIKCRQVGTDGSTRTFYIDLGMSDLMAASLSGSAIYWQANNYKWRSLVENSKLIREKGTGQLHYMFSYSKLSNDSGQFGSGELDIKLSDDLKRIESNNADCNLISKAEIGLSQSGYSCKISDQSALWFVITNTNDRNAMMYQSSKIPPSDTILNGSEMHPHKSLMFTQGLFDMDKYKTFIAGTLDDDLKSAKKYLIPDSSKIGDKAMILSTHSSNRPILSSDIEEKISCKREF